MIILKIEIDSEGIFIDDLLIDESLYEIGVWVSGQAWEGEAD